MTKDKLILTIRKAHSIIKSMKDIALNTTSNLYKGKMKYTHRIDLSLHYHRQIELIYLKKGMLDIHIDDRTLHLTTGDIAVLKPLDLHRLVPLDKNIYLLIILPDRISLKLSAQNITSKKFAKVHGDIKKLLDLHKTFSSIDPDYIWLYFKMTSEIIQRLYNLEKPVSELNEVLDYIHKHFREPITLTSVSTACASNRSYVSKAVNQLTGYHFNSYVNKLRIAYFLEQYPQQTNKKTIEATALEAGFHNPRTFYRAFFAELHCAPTDYFQQQ